MPIDMSIIWSVFMTARTVGFGPLVSHPFEVVKTSLPTTDILANGHNFKMVRVHASPVSTEMVSNKAVRNRAVKLNPEPSVREVRLAFPSTDISVSIGTDSPNPLPAGISDVNLLPESLPWGTGKVLFPRDKRIAVNPEAVEVLGAKPLGVFIVRAIFDRAFHTNYRVSCTHRQVNTGTL